MTILYLPFQYLYIYFCLIAMAKSSKIVLHRCGDGRHPYFNSGTAKTFNVSLLSMMFVVSFL